MRLDLMTWPQVAQRLERDRAIIVPIGSTEQHGPTGLIGTDALVAEAVARRAAEPDDLLVAPTLSVGYAPHHMAFPGTMTLSLPTYVAVLSEWITGLARHGFRHIYVINGHGGNIQPTRKTFEQLAGTLGADVPRLILRNWWEYPAVAAMRETLYGRADGKHATPSEIAVTQFLFAEARAVHQVLEPVIAHDGPIRTAEDYRARFPDGRIASNPALADPGDGERLLEAAARGLRDDFHDFIKAA